MGKLIDTDVLIAQIWEEHKKVEDLYDLCVDELKEVFCGIVALVDEQPTAYDPDWVVEQLEALTEEECTLHECGIRSEHCKACIAKKAIEIVKGGGVDAD